MGLTGKEERACMRDSMRMGWRRGGGDDGGCHRRYMTAAAKLMHPCMCSAHTLIDTDMQTISTTHTRVFALCMHVYASINF